MWYRVKKDLKGNTHDELIQYLARRCDVVTFNVPYPTWQSGQPCPEIFDDEFSEYIDGLKNMYADLKPYIMKEEISNKYMGDSYPFILKIYTVKLCKETEAHFRGKEHICEWAYPYDLADLCFFSKGECYMRTVGRYGLCEIYGACDNELFLLKHMGLKLIKIDADYQGQYDMHYDLIY